MERRLRLHHLPAELAPEQVLVHVEGFHDRQLIVQIGVDGAQKLVTGHRGVSERLRLSRRLALSIRRARKSLDMTVPTGTPRICAISRYEKPAMWARTTVSR